MTLITLVTVVGFHYGKRIMLPEVLADHAVDLERDAAADSLVSVMDGPAANMTVSLESPPTLPDELEMTEMAIGRNQTFYEAMRARGAAHGDIMSLVSDCKPYRNLGKVRRGDMFKVSIDDEGRVRRMSFDLVDQESYIVFSRGADRRYDVFQLTYPVEHRICAVAGRVEVSLYESLKDVGAPPALASKMNDILGWDIDFRRDVRPGDTFSIIYEEVHREGKFLRTGPLMALEYTNRGRKHVGFRHESRDGMSGYYDADGQNLEKQLMRAPLEYSRVSSSFTHRRFHPVHKKWMAHFGVDYAAPVGTPVRAAGNGVILDARYNKNNGRFVQIRHNNRSYHTYYLHLSRFAKGIRKGVKVKRGQVIGYVGATGVATGPHLDYRVKKDGNWVDPRRLKLPPSEPLSKKDLPGFMAQAALYSYCMAGLPEVCTPLKVDPSLPLAPPWQAFLPAVDDAVVLAGISSR